jgi:hypothetical protein
MEKTKPHQEPPFSFIIKPRAAIAIPTIRTGV